MSAPKHPAAALFKGEKPFPVIPTCEHYAGSEKLMQRALALQDSIGPVFGSMADSTLSVASLDDLPNDNEM